MWEAGTGLVRFGSRDDSSIPGRWLSKDATRFRGRDTNLYAYVFADPQNAIDPLGRDAIYVHYDGYPITVGPFRVPLGHAAVIAVDENTGYTRYYEYGRYDEGGSVRRRQVPNLDMGPDGRLTPESLQNLYDFISERYGKGKKVSVITIRIGITRTSSTSPRAG